jgi:hypothetical protein
MRVGFSRLAVFVLRVLVFVSSFGSAGLLATLPAFAAGGQFGNISGTIVDATSKSGVAGARVTFVSPSGTFRAVTVANGTFTIDGITADTYLLTVEATGYDPISQAGITVIGDQTNALGTIRLAKELRVIGHTSAHSSASAFQPTQTTDSVTINSARIEESTGKALSTDQKSVLLAAPGVSVATSGTITIRGGLETEVGYQLDGVPFTDPFGGLNDSDNFNNGVGSVQVVAGPGDATQGNVGAGVINTITKRGTYPSFGTFGADLGGPNFSHQLQFEYGTATKSGNISEYFAYTGLRDVPYSTINGDVGYGQFNTSAATLGDTPFYGTSYSTADAIRNNFIFKFGRDNRQSLQILFDNEDVRSFGDRGGLFLGTSNPLAYYPYDPSLVDNYDIGVNAMVPSYVREYTGQARGPAEPDFANLVPLVPGWSGQPKYPTSPELSEDDRNSLLKFEYDSSLDANTFAALRYYNTWQQSFTSDLIGSAGQGAPTWDITGGQRVGGQLDVTRSFGPRFSVTLHGEYETQKPLWNDYEPYALLGSESGGAYTYGSIVGQCQYYLGVHYNRCNAPDYQDFLPPGPGLPKGGYVWQALGGNVPRLPMWGVDYHNSTFITSAEALRFQWTPVDNLHFDFGYRRDAEIYKYGINPYTPAPLTYTNPTDVDPSTITPDILRPIVDEPRASVALQIDRTDSVRFGYGRSAQFANASTGGTPSGLYNASELAKIPAKPGSICGSQVPNAPTFPCTTYAQQLFWFGDANNDAPDVGSILPTIYSNYDLTYQHEFKNGWGARLTPFYKDAIGVPSFSFLSEDISPTTGQFLGGVFQTNNLGVNHTSGVEFGLTTPDVPAGISGFFSATYQNVFDSVPPLTSGENNVPAITSSSLLLGDVYHAGYVPPIQARLGFSYKTRGGFRVTPSIEYDRGYPYTQGTLTASNVPIGGFNANIPQINFPGGAGLTAVPGFNGSQGVPAATHYADPALPGTALDPILAATRGTPETSSPGGVFSRPNIHGDLTFEYEFKRSTVGIQLFNVAGGPAYGSIPVLNPYYQPVATGVAGFQTNQVPQVLQTDFGASRGYANIPSSYDAFTNAAYLVPLNVPFHVDVYYQYSL